jgi:predicted phosphoribosyltransferase
MFRFADRSAAGRELAPAVPPVDLVLGLPRGGVIVAAELPAPLDVLTVRKLRAPGQPELAFGAIATGGIRVLNPDVVDELCLAPEAVDRITARELTAMTERERAYRGERPPPRLAGRAVAVVDDGIATGATALAACRAARSAGAARVVAAVPVAPPGWSRAFRDAADVAVAALVPPALAAVGTAYEDFRQTTDAEVLALLAAASGGGAPA